jgi:cysteine desulfurase
MMRIYFDNNATTAPDPRVLAAMERELRSTYGNPSSLHAFGRAARRTLEDARAQVAALIGADDREIVLTSSGTEANNLAIMSHARRAAAEKRVIVASPIEHASVMAALTRLEREGFELRWLPVRRDGALDLDQARALFDERVAFAALIWAQNETGVLQPVREIAELCVERSIPLHCDAVQAAGKIAISVDAVRATTLTISGHKFFGPKGAAALFVRSGVRLEPLIVGGGQERERRAGTENVAGIVGLGVAAEIAAAEQAERFEKLARLDERLQAKAREAWPDVRVNGDGAPRVPGTLSFLFPRAHGETLMMNLDLRGIAVSLGAACSSGAIEASHVLKAMGLTLAENYSSLRVSLSSRNTEAEIDRFAEVLVELREAQRA